MYTCCWGRNEIAEALLYMATSSRSILCLFIHRYICQFPAKSSSGGTSCLSWPKTRSQVTNGKSRWSWTDCLRIYNLQFLSSLILPLLCCVVEVEDRLRALKLKNPARKVKLSPLIILLLPLVTLISLLSSLTSVVSAVQLSPSKFQTRTAGPHNERSIIILN